VNRRGRGQATGEPVHIRQNTGVWPRSKIVAALRVWRPWCFLARPQIGFSRQSVGFLGGLCSRHLLPLLCGCNFLEGNLSCRHIRLRLCRRRRLRASRCTRVRRTNLLHSFGGFALQNGGLTFLRKQTRVVNAKYVGLGTAGK
jgi:hypothetical protein